MDVNNQSIEPKIVRVTHNGVTKVCTINGKSYGSITVNGVAYPFDNRSKWPAPTITLSGDNLSTPVVSGVTKYKIYSNGSYIGYVDSNSVWHPEVSV